MNRLFNIDNPVMQFLSKMFDLIVLNLIFILSCIPIITIGASISALYYVCLKMLRGEDPYIWQNFWKSFRQNFKQSTVVWLLFLAAVVILGMDFYIINSQDTTIFAIIRVALWIVCGILACIFIYVFPIISHFVCTTKQAIKNAVLMTVGHFPASRNYYISLPVLCEYICPCDHAQRSLRILRYCFYSLHYFRPDLQEI